MTALTGLELIKAYRKHPENYLPFVDRKVQTPARNEYGEVNIGWNAGLIGENRPYFAECWATDGITMLTVYMSSSGLEDKTPDELAALIQESGYYRAKEGDQTPTVGTFTNPRGEGFFSINIGVGAGEEPALIEGAPVIPWKVLNDYNRETAAQESFNKYGGSTLE